MSENVVIVAAARTPVGSFGGSGLKAALQCVDTGQSGSGIARLYLT